MLDLFKIARSNAHTAEKEFNSLVAVLPTDDVATVRAFADWVKSESLISINLRLFILLDVIGGKAHQNIYEWAEEAARLGGRKAEEALRERLGRFYDRRIAFDGAFRDGRKFRYGALYAGGIGLPVYGPYCVVLKSTFRNPQSNLAYLAGESLSVCFTPTGVFDQTAAVRSSICQSHIHLTVAKERSSEVCRSNRDEWHNCIATPDRFFEAVFTAAVTLDAIKVVLVRKLHFDLMWDLAFANFGRKLEEAEKALVHDFIRLRRATERGTIQVEVVG
jgi:hypothetical protein